MTPKSLIMTLKSLINALSTRAFAVNGAWVVATQVIGKGTATLLSLLLARSLSVGNFAIFSYLFTTAAALSSYLAAGLPIAILRAVAEGREERSWARDDRLGAILLIAALTSVLAVLAAPVYLPWLSSNEVPVSGPLLLAAALAMTGAALGQAGLYGGGRFRAAFRPVLVGTAIVVACTIAGLALNSLTTLIVGNIAGILWIAFAYVRDLFRHGVLHRRHWSGWPERTAIVDVLGTNLPGLGINIVYASMGWILVRFLIEQQVSPDQFNMYAIGYQWFTLVLFIPLAFGQVLFPQFVAQVRSGSLSMAQIALPAGLTFSAVFACALVGSLLTPALSWVYGGKYQFEPAFVFTILLAAALSGTVTLLGTFVMAARSVGLWSLVYMTTALVAAALVWVLPLSTALEAARMLCLIQLTPVALAIVIAAHYQRDRLVQSTSRQAGNS